MMLTISDWAPIIVAAVAAGSGLIFLWLAVRQAHAGERRRPPPETQPGE